MREIPVYLDVSVPAWRSQRYAAAVLRENDHTFLSMNDLFSAIFTSAITPGGLLELIISESPVKTVLRHDQRHWELQRLPLDDTSTLFLLRDITSEITLLQKLKNQLQNLTMAEHLYKEILEDLPVGVMVVEANLDAIYANGALKRFFHLPPRAHLKKCYNYVREIKPCKNCILEDPGSGQSNRKKVYEVDNTFITAEAHGLENKYIITFRDTTREIHLIRQIREQRENLEKAHRLVAEQNDILKRLSNINIRIAQLKDLEAILGEVIIAIKDTFLSSRGAIVLRNRAGHIEYAHFTGAITENEREHIIRLASNPGDLPEPEIPNFQITAMRRDGQTVGHIFLHHPEKVIDPSTLELFLMQVMIFLDNLKLQRRLEEIAQTDSLTGVFNRYWFDRQFKTEKEQSIRFHQPMALIVADVNGLKEANDTLGHEAGDVLIRASSALMAAEAGEFDSLFRVGGDEFIILLSNCDEARLSDVISRLRSHQAEASVSFGDRRFPVRFSLGGACSQSTNHEKLKDAADKRMYEDKEDYYKHHKRYR